MPALFRANLKEAVDSLATARQRSLLALIGIVIGVGSVTALISVGAVVRDEAFEQFRELGTDILTVRLGTAPSSPGAAEGVTPDVANGLAALPAIADAAPFAQSQAVVSAAGRALGNMSIIGATAALDDLNKLRLEAGRFISDLDRRRYFCVIGSEVAAAMRGAGVRPLIGGTVRTAGAVWTVVGVLRRTPRGMRPFNADRSVIVPISTALRVFSRPEIRSITARMGPGTDHVRAARDIDRYLRRGRPHLDVRVRSAERLIEQMYKQMRLFALMLGSVDGISLLVGGIGVMNVMLATVGERRLEIGIRRALGARRADIQAQFLIETVLLSLLGGVFGVVLGVGATWGICQFAGWNFLVSTVAMGLGVGVSAASGVFFGFYPAWRAARLDPVAALRGT